MKEGAVSRYAHLKESSDQLMHENLKFKELLTYLCSRPETEAFEVYRRLRVSHDPLTTLQYLRDADTLLNIPSFNACGMVDREVDKIDSDALALSVIKVPARPWTSVTGDGLVSNLITAFFKWDAPFGYSFIDRELFVRDMRSGSLKQTRYCSPLLVNSICALRSVSRLVYAR